MPVRARCGRPITDVPDGGIIEFDPLIHSQSITLNSGPLTVSGKSVTIRSPGGSATMYIAALPVGTARVLVIDSSAAVNLEGIYMSNGYDPAGGGCIRNEGTLTMLDSCVLFGRAMHGAGIWNTGTLAMTGCYLVSNTALGGRGGAIWSSGPVSLDRCFLSANYADDGGGAIWMSGNLDDGGL